MKATGAILTGWPLFYLGATSPSPPKGDQGRETKWKHEREPSHQLPFVYVVRSHIVPDLGSPRTRINLSTTGYTDTDTHATPMRIQTTRPIVIPVIY